MKALCVTVATKEVDRDHMRNQFLIVAQFMRKGGNGHPVHHRDSSSSIVVREISRSSSHWSSTERRESYSRQFRSRSPGPRSRSSSVQSRKAESTSSLMPTRSCPLSWCTQSYGYLKAHFHNFHFPTKIDKRAGVSEKTTEDRKLALEYLASLLVGSNATIDVTCWSI